MSSIQSLLQFRYEKKGIEKIQKEKVDSNHDNPKSEDEGTLIKYRIQKADTPTKNNQDNGILKYYKAFICWKKFANNNTRSKNRPNKLFYKK